jgi:hypothetical protein
VPWLEVSARAEVRKRATNMENLTARYNVHAVGLKEAIDAVSFQDAAKQMLEKHGLTSVRSIAVEYDGADLGTVEFVDCEIVDGRFERRATYILDVKDETEETRERLELLVMGRASNLVFDGIYYRVDEQRVEPPMVIRRYDPVAHNWFEGKVGQISSFDPKTGQRHSSLALVVEGYAPSPLVEGDLIEIVSRAELYNREMDERNRIAYENRPKPWLRGWSDE